MTITTEQLQDIYEAAVREEATGNPDESGEEAFDLLCLLDNTGGTGATIRKLIDMMRAANREAQPVKNTVLFEHSGCGYGAQIDMVTVKLNRGDVVVQIPGNIKKVINEKGEQSVIIYTAPPAPAVPDCFLELLKHAGGMAMGTDWNSGTAAKYHRTKLCEAVEACRAAMLAQPVSSGYKLPDNVREALTLALHAMEFMGDTLNNIDAVCTEDVEYVTPAFNAVRELLAAAPEDGN